MGRGNTNPEPNSTQENCELVWCYVDLHGRSFGFVELEPTVLLNTVLMVGSRSRMRRFVMKTRLCAIIWLMRQGRSWTKKAVSRT